MVKILRLPNVRAYKYSLTFLLMSVAMGCSQKDNFSAGESYSECILINLKYTHTQGAVHLMREACSDIHGSK